MRGPIIIACIIVVIIILFLARHSKESFSNKDIRLKTLVINLDKNPERLAKIMGDYIKSDISKIPITRFAAIDANQIDIKEYVTPSALVQIQQTNNNGFRTRHHDLTTGAVGCFLSHIGVMRQLLNDTTCDVYLVLEDDANIPLVLYNHVKQVCMLSANMTWDIMVLGKLHHSVKENYNNTFDRLYTFWGTHAILINKQGARKVVQEYEANRISKQIDSMMSLMIKQDKLIVYAPRNLVKGVQVGGFTTDIQVPIKQVQGIDPFDLEKFRN